MSRLTENNDEFYGKRRKPNKLKGNPGNVDLEFESINPYEFKKGMNYELNKVGVLTLREASEEDREKATEAVLKNLKDVPAYYSYMEHYETTTRNMDRKPSFKTFLKELEGHSMKEVTEKFTEDKMKEIKLKESIRAEVRNKINEVLGNKNINEGREVKVTDTQKRKMLKVAEDLRNLVKTHDGVEGTRLLNGKMQQRDTLIKAANTLETLAK